MSGIKKSKGNYLPAIEGHKDAKILIVDDSEFSRVLLENLFHGKGFMDTHIATDGEDAIAKTLSLKPDLVILDVMMPKLDGYEYCRIIRGEYGLYEMPILVQSAIHDPKKISGIFKAGASDFISKPVNPDEVIARALIHMDRYRLLRDFRTFKNRVEGELAKAKEMQISLMPAKAEIIETGKKYSIDVAAYFETSSELGGDLWGMRPLSASELAVYAIDFSGHGISSALNTFRAHTILKEDKGFSISPDVFLSKFNKKLCEVLATGQFATMFYGIINTDENMLYYSAAASPAPAIVDASGKVQFLDSAGFPLGVDKNSEYEIRKAEFKKGDTLMIYSDALIETPNYGEEFITEKDVAVLLAKGKNKSSQEKLDIILKSFNEHAAKSPDDDLTINLYQRL